jgi:hypothetical protein
VGRCSGDRKLEGGDMLKVYMTGLVYIHGCNAAAPETPVALLPDGTDGGGDHCASLWADEGSVDLSSSESLRFADYRVAGCHREATRRSLRAVRFHERVPQVHQRSRPR